MSKKLQIYIGTFSTHFFSGLFNEDTLEIEDLHMVEDPGGRSPWLVMDPEEKFLYAASEWMDGAGGIAAFKRVEGQDPVFLNAIPANTQGPAMITYVEAYGKKFVMGAGLFEGDVMICPVAEDGSLLPMSHNFNIADVKDWNEAGRPTPTFPEAKPGESAGVTRPEDWNKVREMSVSNRGQAHGLKQIPGTNFIIVPDTLNGELYTFLLTPEGKFELRQVFKDPKFQCPRHMTFSKDGTRLYFLTERTNTMDAFKINAETGELTHFFQGNNLPDDFTGNDMSAAIHRSPDGRFVYLSNRGHNSIVVYNIETDDIKKVGYADKEIDWPREFLITPDGDFLLVGNQEIKTVSIFKINHETGIPEYTGKTISLPGDVGAAAFISSPRTDD